MPLVNYFSATPADFEAFLPVVQEVLDSVCIG
jgi:hypothetical protein